MAFQEESCACFVAEYFDKLFFDGHNYEKASKPPRGTRDKYMTKMLVNDLKVQEKILSRINRVHKCQEVMFLHGIVTVGGGQIDK